MNRKPEHKKPIGDIGPIVETGPDEEIGIFGRLAPDGSADYVPVMRFESTTAKPLVKEMPILLVALLPPSQASARRKAVAVRLRDREHSLGAELVAGADHAHRNLAAVGDEDAFECRSQLSLPCEAGEGGRAIEAAITLRACGSTDPIAPLSASLRAA